jgi:uncharacterized protein YgbK (DUF1537 family)
VKLRVLSDDLTGANDVALKLVKYGFRVRTRFGALHDRWDGIDLLSSETRSLPSEKAYSEVSRVFGEIRQAGYDSFYKKTDSALRGNIRAELQAITERLDTNERLIFVVTYPASRRALIGGRLYINGVPVSETSFRNDPVHPIKVSDIQSFVPCRVIGIDDARNRPEDSLNTIGDSKVIAVEGETEEDLRRLAVALKKTGYDRNIAGAPAILEHLLHAWGYRREKVLLVWGSCHSASIRQTRAMKTRPGVRYLKLDMDKETDVDDIEEEVIFVGSVEDEREVPKTLQKHSPGQVAESLAETVHALIEKYGIRKIAISGGDTAIAIFRRLGIDHLAIDREVSLAVACGRFRDYEVITKPGSYGGDDGCEEILKAFGK